MGSSQSNMETMLKGMLEALKTSDLEISDSNEPVPSSGEENNNSSPPGSSDEQIIAGDDNSYKEFLDRSREATNERDILFNDFLAAYTDSFESKSQQKILLKNWFFILIMIIFFIIVATPVFVIIFFANQNNTMSFVVTIIGSFVELLSAFIILPQIIAEYLFNKEEDNNMVTIIEKMQSYNLEKIKGDHENKP